MSPLITEEAVLLVRSVMYGVFLGAGYDVLHWPMVHLFRDKWWCGLEDLLYWTLCALIIFAMIREENGGTIRWYVLAGAVAGSGIYRGGFRPILHRLLKPLWKPIRKIRQFVENLLKK